MSAALARLQRDFMAALEAATPCPPGIAVYRRGMAATRERALAAAYPVVLRLVGAAFFAEAAAQYGRAHPSRSGDLHGFGAGLAGFLAAYPHAAGLPYLPDVARLEWAMHEALHAADTAPLDFAALAAVPAARHDALRFALAPCVRRVASVHPVLALWEANQPPRDGTPASQEPQRVVVWRAAGEVRARALDPAEWAFAGALAAGETLAAAQAALGDEAAARLDPLLSLYAREGLLSGFGLDAAA